MATKVIVAESSPRGKFVEGLADEALTPGMGFRVKANTEPVSGRFTYEKPDLTANGDAVPGLGIVDLDRSQGKTVSDSYAANERVFGYIPVNGEEVYLLFKASVANLQIGDLAILEDDTGLWLKTTGSPGSQPFMVKETSATSASARLVLCEFVGK